MTTISIQDEPAAGLTGFDLIKRDMDLVEQIVNGLGAWLREPDAYSVSVFGLGQTPYVFPREGEGRDTGQIVARGHHHFKLALLMVQELGMSDVKFSIVA